MSENHPVHEIRSGSVKAAIWANEPRNGTMHTTTFDRRYKDGEEWRSSQSFGPFDLVHLMKCAAEAQLWVRSVRARNRESEAASQEPQRSVGLPERPPASC